MSVNSGLTGAPRPDHYKWVALSNTTLGILMAMVNSSIVLISLPAIFRGVKVNPLAPGNVSLLLWMLMGYMVVIAVLVVSLGRVGDMFGRVRMYNLGFLVFTIASVFLSVVFFTGDGAALTLIGLRIIQGVGGALLMANSAAILTDAFPSNQRGMALGINVVAGISGSFVGLVLGGLLSGVDWHLVFLVSVPIGIFGTVWAYLKLREIGIVTRAKIDWLGNITFGVGLIALLVGITYGIQPYGNSDMGWTNPTVLVEIFGGIALLGAFVLVERRVAAPMFNLALFQIRAFTAGNMAALLASIGRGGLMFMLIIWLQGIWLPLHGYNFVQTPLWAAIYMLPLTGGFLAAGPLSGVLSDRYGARPFATGGMLAAAATFALLALLPANFSYPSFAVLLFFNGFSMGMFSAPNTAGIMNSVPADQRGVASGMRSTFQNSGMTLSIGLFFTLMVLGLAASLPSSLYHGLVQQGVPVAAAQKISNLPPVGTLFAAFLGYNPVATLLGPTLHHLPAARTAVLTGREFFPNLISKPFMAGMRVTFYFAMVMMLVAAAASWLRGKRYVHGEASAKEAPPGWALERVTPGPQELAMDSDGGGRLRAVTISASYAAGGDAIGRAVAERLGIPFLERAIPVKVASELAAPLESAMASEDWSRDGVGELFAALSRDVVPLPPAAAPGVNREDGGELFRRRTERAVRGMAAHGGVILGRGATAVLAGVPGVLHVRLDGPPERRIRRLVESGAVDEATARLDQAHTDRAREAYMRHFYGVDLKDPELYDLVIDTTTVAEDAAVEMIVEATVGRVRASA
ncbi:MAG TPA: MFS transporter [Candidatus Nanopelagicaceae bacterium]|nr:MFS transporter [Candidatus Nanopelagicaceae bacterium]